MKKDEREYMDKVDAEKIKDLIKNNPHPDEPTTISGFSELLGMGNAIHNASSRGEMRRAYRLLLEFWFNLPLGSLVLKRESVKEPSEEPASDCFTPKDREMLETVYKYMSLMLEAQDA